MVALPFGTLKKTSWRGSAGCMVRRRIPGSRFQRARIIAVSARDATLRCGMAAISHLYTSDDPIGFRDAREPGRRVLGRAFLAVLEIDVDEAEALRVTLAP